MSTVDATRSERRSGVNGALTARGLRPVVENSAYSAFGRRVIRAAGRRIADGDIDGLPDLLALAGEVDGATTDAVRGLRDAGYSWGEIASRLHISRQAAQQRWG